MRNRCPQNQQNEKTSSQNENLQNVEMLIRYCLNVDKCLGEQFVYQFWNTNSSPFFNKNSVNVI